MRGVGQARMSDRLVGRPTDIFLGMTALTMYEYFTTSFFSYTPMFVMTFGRAETASLSAKIALAIRSNAARVSTIPG